MITILAVGGPREELASAFVRHPSVELLAAREIEDALEKLARNRRIDAVLLLDRDHAATTARTILEEDPASPPMYAPASWGAIPGVLSLGDAPPATLVEALAERLQMEP